MNNKKKITITFAREITWLIRLRKQLEGITQDIINLSEIIEELKKDIKKGYIPNSSSLLEDYEELLTNTKELKIKYEDKIKSYDKVLENLKPSDIFKGNE